MTSLEQRQKPALEGAGKTSSFSKTGPMVVFALIAGSLASLGIWSASVNSTIEDWRAKNWEWVGKCVEGQPTPALVTTIEPNGEDAWVAVNDGMQVTLPLSTLRKTDCTSVAAEDGSPTVIAGQLEELSDKKRSILRLQADLETIKLKLEIATLTRDYMEVLKATPNRAVVVDDVSDEQEIKSTMRAIELLKLKLEEAQLTRQLRETLDFGSDRSSK